MATLKDIKLRMSSIQNTQQITKAMKMVSASKMKRAEDRIIAARPYSEKLRAIVSNLASGVDPSSHPLLEERKGGKAIVLLLTSDRGLCGGLNTNLCKALEKFIPDQSTKFEFVELVSFGKKGAEFFKPRELTVSETFRDLKETELANALNQRIRELIQQYNENKFNHLYLAYNRFKNVISQIVTISQVLPIVSPAPVDQGVDDDIEFSFEPSSEEILNAILPQYVENQAYTALLDNIACEHAARMTAMDSATKNAEEMLSTLQLQYNRARQAAITSELIEIISGAEAL